LIADYFFTTEDTEGTEGTLVRNRDRRANVKGSASPRFSLVSWFLGFKVGCIFVYAVSREVGSGASAQHVFSEDLVRDTAFLRAFVAVLLEPEQLFESKSHLQEWEW